MATEALSLYQLEENHMALLDSEALVTPDQQAQFRAEIAESLKTAVDKRERVAQFLRHCELQAENCKKEIDRLSRLKRSYEGAAKRMEEHVAWSMEQLGYGEKDARGRVRKLEAHTAVFTLRPNPPAVEITDEAAVPSEYKTLTITVNAAAWEQHIESHQEMRGLMQRALNAFDPVPLEQPQILRAIRKTECAIDKRAVKEALESGASIPGADLKIGEYSLRVA